MKRRTEDFVWADPPQRMAFPVAKAGYPLICGAAFARLILALLGLTALALIGLAAAFAVAGFFAVRNPRHELRVRDLVRELTGKPVTCAHELSSNLDAPRRALTAVLNARLIPQLDLLIRAVQGLRAAHDLKAPLMVVKGDGSDCR